MFLVINKEKVYAYIVSVFTIVTLFVMSGILNSNFDKTEQTSSNIELNNTGNATINVDINNINNTTTKEMTNTITINK